jgi:hypothetical protein
MLAVVNILSCLTGRSSSKDILLTLPFYAEQARQSLRVISSLLHTCQTNQRLIPSLFPKEEKEKKKGRERKRKKKA